MGIDGLMDDWMEVGEVGGPPSQATARQPSLDEGWLGGYDDTHGLSERIEYSSQTQRQVRAVVCVCNDLIMKDKIPGLMKLIYPGTHLFWDLCP